MPLRTSQLGPAGIAVLGLLLTGCGGENRPETAPAVLAVSPVRSSPTSTPAPASSDADVGRPTTVGATPSPTPTPTPTDPVTPRTSAPTSSTSSTAPVSSGCRRLTDFDGDTDGWFVVDDGVMGGRSNGNVEFTDSEMRFSGEVVTRGGGFTSVRLGLDGTELDGTSRLVLRVRADGRTYGLTMEDSSRSGRRAVSHRADLTFDRPTGGDDGTTVSIAYDVLEPTVFGRPVDADAFDPDAATEIGIIIADGEDGAFALAVDWIDACA